VLLDRDLAALYGVETRALNQAVRRNASRFPADFMFALTRDEIRNISQFVISSGFKHAPQVLVFTEQGVAMLSSVLRSPRAIAVNIEIMRAFVRLRQLISSSADLARKLATLERKYGAQFRGGFRRHPGIDVSEIARPPSSRSWLSHRYSRASAAQPEA
jgi:hypothetical protein